MKRNKTTIFNELIFNVLSPALIALLVLGAINYHNLRKIMMESNRNKNIMLVDQIKYILEFQDMSLETIESTMNDRMEKYSNTLTNDYFSDTRNIEKANLNVIRSKMGMNGKMEDIYIINDQGTVVNTTFPKDKGLNLFAFGAEHEHYLKNVFKNGKFISERFTIESTTRRLKKYTYQPTRDGKYIIELGVYSQKADEVITFIKTRLNTLSQVEGTIKNVDLFIITDKPFSLTENGVLSKAEKPVVDSVCHTRSQLNLQKTIKGEIFDYDYIYMDRKNSTLYKGSVIKVVADRTKEVHMLRNELIKLFAIFTIAIVIVVILLYRKTRVITNPIKSLVASVNRITNGHFNERVEILGNNEIATLSEQFNQMIEELESLYNDLEQKVRDRTAEIMQQKEEIETQRDAIEEQKDMLLDVNKTLESANKEISAQKKQVTDSIIYSKRIQTAILPANEQVKKLFPQSFILYRPKDIVSGDFYWVAEVDNFKMIAAVDCTGHGVPGAFMSILGYNNLNHAVNYKGARMAGDVLRELNHAVIDTLSQQEEDIRDGMDVAICCFDVANNKLYYAGANNPLIMVRNNEIFQYEPTKAPIGKNDEFSAGEFQNNEIDMQPGDIYYIFSDGYADQFGGTENKKFLKRRLKALLHDISGLPMEEQKKRLGANFDEWKGRYEQVDDIMIIGVQV
jgi:phosphoserine phosphatase RsbU/P